ncbi:hypothetical protein [Microbacterium aurum]|uniref:hypothetical protein n=1 Tax=Microbacterium aurum TaxID=36805 RepID=UPI0028EB4727|nr:hypothetical protein [Microbacterium aurum]
MNHAVDRHAWLETRLGDEHQHVATGGAQLGEPLPIVTAASAAMSAALSTGRRWYAVAIPEPNSHVAGGKPCRSVARPASAWSAANPWLARTSAPTPGSSHSCEKKKCARKLGSQPSSGSTQKPSA